MCYKLQMFIIFMLSFLCFTQSDPLEISLSSFFPSKSVKCYKCSSLKNTGCKNITNDISNEKLLEECKGKATGCVKQWIRTEEGKIIIYRDCYYGAMSFFKDLDCKDIRNYGYNTQRCYKCQGSLCNSSNHLGPLSKYMIYFTTMVFFITSFILRI